MTEQIDGVRTFGNPPQPVVDVVDEAGNTYCQVHTDRETGLRCNNCTRLLCAQCAVQTPVGYRCRECVRQQEDRYFNATTSDYAVGFVVSAGLSAVGAFVAQFLGFGFFGLIIAFIIGGFVAGVITEGILRVRKGKRGRYSAQVAAAGVIVGTFMVALFGYLQIGAAQIAQIERQMGPEAAEQARQQLRQIRPSFFAYLFSQIQLIVYAAIAAVGVYGRFR